MAENMARPRNKKRKSKLEETFDAFDIMQFYTEPQEGINPYAYRQPTQLPDVVSPSITMTKPASREVDFMDDLIPPKARVEMMMDPCVVRGLLLISGRF
jgi:hypothetical protein